LEGLLEQAVKTEPSYGDFSIRAAPGETHSAGPNVMSVAELRMGAMSAGWGSDRRPLLERFVHGFELFYPDNKLCTFWARIRAEAEQLAERLY
jgi:predicted nucleic acid-binding protein